LADERGRSDGLMSYVASVIKKQLDEHEARRRPTALVLAREEHPYRVRAREGLPGLSSRAGLQPEPAESERKSPFGLGGIATRSVD
jgi:hypothetical protein